MFGNELLEAVANLKFENRNKTCAQELKVGVDLGTSSIVLVVLNERNEPLVCLSEEAEAVKDGVVVNFFEASKIVKRLKEQAEAFLGCPLVQAAGAIPPQVGEKNTSAVAHVIEAAGLETGVIVDEPCAAAEVLKIKHGAVIDIGGGTTGISIFEDGKAVYSADEATGGYHMALVLAGHYQISLSAAEIRKRDQHKYEEHFQILKPVIEKMAHLSKQFIADYGNPVSEVYLVGGASMFPQFTEVFESTLAIPVKQPVHPRLVTPVGIAMLGRL